ncbi:hypothetical protein BLNAU_4163 [Blattamonas nauphoetae]|uniref:Uncharacterized protein n=1 Tax=Blattamonas nauphoetae TaxID=2049346 RepID=A0ABQ9YAJ6_9EUKA|nr:hypothetical protein BLNAU_4163 [Blattamonas nauphoetae]
MGQAQSFLSYKGKLNTLLDQLEAEDPFHEAKRQAVKTKHIGEIMRTFKPETVPLTNVKFHELLFRTIVALVDVGVDAKLDDTGIDIWDEQRCLRQRVAVNVIIPSEKYITNVFLRRREVTDPKTQKLLFKLILLLNGIAVSTPELQPIIQNMGVARLMVFMILNNEKDVETDQCFEELTRELEEVKRTPSQLGSWKSWIRCLCEEGGEEVLNARHQNAPGEWGIALNLQASSMGNTAGWNVG